jgi:anaerobic magnesium-protoporphyrin IX monomethyl ester cyclase
MKVLLVQPEIDRAMIHLGLGYLSTALESRGDKVKILDIGIEGESERKIAKFIESFHPDAVGITVQTHNYSKALMIAGLVRRLNPKCPVIMGGPHPSILTEATLKEPTVDIIVRGEGDITIVELMDCLEHGGNLDSIRGISFKTNGNILHNEDRPFVKDINTIPFPAWHLFNMDGYLAKINGCKVAPVLSSRGCPYKCIFCYRGPAAGKIFRPRVPENVISEIEQLKDRYGIGNILFVDDTFTLNQKRAERISDLLIEKKLGISWRCQTRADCLNLKLLTKMKMSNCIDISIGVESGNWQILATTQKQKKNTNYSKQFNINDFAQDHEPVGSIENKSYKQVLRKAFKMAAEVGISTSATFIIGLPGDTKESVQETIDFAKELNPNYAIFYAAMPYPGTELSRIIKERGGKLPENWDDYRLMSSDIVSSKMVAAFNISELSEKELGYYLKTAQIQFQMGRLSAGGEKRAIGITNIFQIIKLSFIRAKSFREFSRFILRVMYNGALFAWRRLSGR